MSALVQVLQALSGVLWLLPAVYLTPRLIRAWRAQATRMELLSAPVCCLSWLMAGFTLRWLTWPTSIASMGAAELTAWAALYALSALCAAWFFVGARQTRGQ